MKNNININLGGRIIEIDHNAFKIYLAYIETLRCYFINEQGCFEILNDIENRVAEKMQGINYENKSLIHEKDMQNIIQVMGTADDFKKLDCEDSDFMLQENNSKAFKGSILCSN
ncbi:MAG: hypothetical protein WBP16_06330 [Ferruginibacter sp.]